MELSSDLWAVIFKDEHGVAKLLLMSSVCKSTRAVLALKDRLRIATHAESDERIIRLFPGVRLIDVDFIHYERPAHAGYGADCNLDMIYEHKEKCVADTAMAACLPALLAALPNLEYLGVDHFHEQEFNPQVRRVTHLFFQRIYAARKTGALPKLKYIDHGYKACYKSACAANFVGGPQDLRPFELRGLSPCYCKSFVEAAPNDNLFVELCEKVPRVCRSREQLHAALRRRNVALSDVPNPYMRLGLIDLHDLDGDTSLFPRLPAYHTLLGEGLSYFDLAYVRSCAGELWRAPDDWFAFENHLGHVVFDLVLLGGRPSAALEQVALSGRLHSFLEMVMRTEWAGMHWKRALRRPSRLQNPRYRTAADQKQMGCEQLSLLVAWVSKVRAAELNAREVDAENGAEDEAVHFWYEDVDGDLAGLPWTRSSWPPIADEER